MIGHLTGHQQLARSEARTDPLVTGQSNMVFVGTEASPTASTLHLNNGQLGLSDHGGIQTPATPFADKTSPSTPGAGKRSSSPQATVSPPKIPAQPQLLIDQHLVKEQLTQYF
jgi:hypothetical protein